MYKNVIFLAILSATEKLPYNINCTNNYRRRDREQVPQFRKQMKLWAFFYVDISRIVDDVPFLDKWGTASHGVPAHCTRAAGLSWLADWQLKPSSHVFQLVDNGPTYT